jgi:hypothetical protein
MLGWICEKMTILKSTPKGGRFYASNLITVGNDALACNDPCAPGRDCLIVAEDNSWDNTHTSNLSSKGKRLGRESNTLVQCTQPMGESSNG